MKKNLCIALTCLIFSLACQQQEPLKKEKPAQRVVRYLDIRYPMGLDSDQAFLTYLPQRVNTLEKRIQTDGLSATIEYLKTEPDYDSWLFIFQAQAPYRLIGYSRQPAWFGKTPDELQKEFWPAQYGTSLVSIIKNVITISNQITTYCNYEWFTKDNPAPSRHLSYSTRIVSDGKAYIIGVMLPVEKFFTHIILPDRIQKVLERIKAEGLDSVAKTVNTGLTGEYFFVTQLDYPHRFIMHREPWAGLTPEQARDLYTPHCSDPACDVATITHNMLPVVREGGGFHAYIWQNSPREEPIVKLVYLMPFEYQQKKLFIGTGLSAGISHQDAEKLTQLVHKYRNLINAIGLENTISAIRKINTPEQYLYITQLDEPRKYLVHASPIFDQHTLPEIQKYLGKTVDISAIVKHTAAFTQRGGGFHAYAFLSNIQKPQEGLSLKLAYTLPFTINNRHYYIGMGFPIDQLYGILHKKTTAQKPQVSETTQKITLQKKRAIEYLKQCCHFKLNSDEALTKYLPTRLDALQKLISKTPFDELAQTLAHDPDLDSSLFVFQAETPHRIIAYSRRPDLADSSPELVQKRIKHIGTLLPVGQLLTDIAAITKQITTYSAHLWFTTAEQHPTPHVSYTSLFEHEGKKYIIGVTMPVQKNFAHIILPHRVNQVLKRIKKEGLDHVASTINKQLTYEYFSMVELEYPNRFISHREPWAGLTPAQATQLYNPRCNNTTCDVAAIISSILTVTHQGDGFHAYLWQSDLAQKPTLKIIYLKNFTYRGKKIMIFTGLPADIPASQATALEHFVRENVSLIQKIGLNNALSAIHKINTPERYVYIVQTDQPRTFVLYPLPAFENHTLVQAQRYLDRNGKAPVSIENVASKTISFIKNGGGFHAYLWFADLNHPEKGVSIKVAYTLPLAFNGVHYYISTGIPIEHLESPQQRPAAVKQEKTIPEEEQLANKLVFAYLNQCCGYNLTTDDAFTKYLPARLKNLEKRVSQLGITAVAKELTNDPGLDSSLFIMQADEPHHMIAYSRQPQWSGKTPDELQQLVWPTEHPHSLAKIIRNIVVLTKQITSYTSHEWIAPDSSIPTHHVSYTTCITDQGKSYILGVTIPTTRSAAHIVLPHRIEQVLKRIQKEGLKHVASTINKELIYEYFFVTQRGYPYRYIMHKRSWAGLTAAEVGKLIDPDCTHSFCDDAAIIKTLARIANQGGGFHAYLWQNQPGEKPTLKIVYVKPFEYEKQKLLIATGLPADIPAQQAEDLEKLVKDNLKLIHEVGLENIISMIKKTNTPEHYVYIMHVDQPYSYTVHVNPLFDQKRAIDVQKYLDRYDKSPANIFDIIEKTIQFIKYGGGFHAYKWLIDVNNSKKGISVKVAYSLPFTDHGSHYYITAGIPVEQIESTEDITKEKEKVISDQSKSQKKFIENDLVFDYLKQHSPYNVQSDELVTKYLPERLKKFKQLVKQIGIKKAAQSLNADADLDSFLFIFQYNAPYHLLAYSRHPEWCNKTPEELQQLLPSENTTNLKEQILSIIKSAILSESYMQYQWFANRLGNQIQVVFFVQVHDHEKPYILGVATYINRSYEHVIIPYNVNALIKQIKQKELQENIKLITEDPTTFRYFYIAQADPPYRYIAYGNAPNLINKTPLERQYHDDPTLTKQHFNYPKRIQDLLEIARKGGGFYAYFWPIPGMREKYTIRIAYTKLFESDKKKYLLVNGYHSNIPPENVVSMQKNLEQAYQIGKNAGIGNMISVLKQWTTEHKEIFCVDTTPPITYIYHQSEKYNRHSVSEVVDFLNKFPQYQLKPFAPKAAILAKKGGGLMADIFFLDIDHPEDGIGLKTSIIKPLSIGNRLYYLSTGYVHRQAST